MNAHLQEIHPGEILREEFMVPLGLSEAELISALEATHGEINALLAEAGPVTPNLAQSLSTYFKVSLQFWLNLQKEYDARMAVNGGKQ